MERTYRVGARHRQINSLTRKLGLAVPRWLMNGRMSEAIACIVKAIAFQLQLDEGLRVPSMSSELRLTVGELFGWLLE